MAIPAPTPRRDEGSVLPIVLVISVVLALVVLGLATYATSTLRFGQSVEASADRLATANGAMDNALEDLDRGASRCALSGIPSQSGGLTFSLGDTINGMNPTVNCQVIGGTIAAVDQYAVIMTGANGQSGPLLEITNGGNSAQAQKVFTGPIYMARTPTDLGATPTLAFNATLTLEQGDLWYTNATCPSNAVHLPSQLTMTPAGYTTKCETEDWLTMFGGKKPIEPAVAGFPLRSSTAPAPDSLGCYVWPPGRYEAPPDLQNQSYNYFQSGDYYFKNFGMWQIKNSFVLAGWPGATGPSIDGPNPQDTFSNNKCRDAWANDPDHTGAAFYFGGNSQIEVQSGSTLEISGKKHGDINVGVQALEAAGVNSTLTGNDDIIRTETGGNKQLSVQGFIWAPFAAFEFDLISNDAVAALTGGAVIAELSAGASANANNFLITVDTQPTTARLLITTSAMNKGTTRVRTLLDYRTDTEYAVLSRRVLELTPE